MDSTGSGSGYTTLVLRYLSVVTRILVDTVPVPTNRFSEEKKKIAFGLPTSKFSKAERKALPTVKKCTYVHAFQNPLQSPSHF